MMNLIRNHILDIIICLLLISIVALSTTGYHLSIISAKTPSAAPAMKQLLAEDPSLTEMCYDGVVYLVGAKAANITRVNHHDCGGCGHVVFFSREDDELHFHPDCNCTSRWAPPERRSWEDAANWINMQSNAEVRNRLRVSFGLLPE